MNCPLANSQCKHIGNEAVCRQCPHEVPNVKKPAKDNKYKQEIDLIFGALGCDVVKEYKFHASRKWRWDWAMPAIKVAVEYQGLNFAGGTSRHQTIGGITGDCEKYSEAAIDGWCLVLVTAISVQSGLAHSLIKRAIDSRRLFLPQVASASRKGDFSGI